MDIKITFWGVRGSKPSPGKNTLLFGGNTSCVQVEIGDRNLILDGGTGISELGNLIMKEEGKKNADIFFSHLHWDHIQGLPFFIPLFKEGNDFRLYGEDKGDMKFRQIIEGQMTSPYFPITMKMMKSNIDFFSIYPSQDLVLDQDITIKTFAVNHPNGCLAYRIEKGNSAIVYCTDTEPIEENKSKFLEFVRGADVFIYDSHFTDEEYLGIDESQSKKRWGHSTWQEGTRISKEADIGYLILYHHRESRSDVEQLEIEVLAQEQFNNTIAAREGLTISVGGGSIEKVVFNYPY